MTQNLASNLVFQVPPLPSQDYAECHQSSFQWTVAQREAGQDVVIRGDDTDANRRLAYRVEAAVGPPTRPQPPERQAGPLALPHFRQQSRDPAGHLFYETEKRKARKRP